MTRKLNANQLKLIAIIAMTIDHFTDLFYPGFPAEPIPVVLHLIGRLTAPIMWFFVVEGYHHTRNVKKYMLRMGLFAVISHFAYCYGFGSASFRSKQAYSIRQALCIRFSSQWSLCGLKIWKKKN